MTHQSSHRSTRIGLLVPSSNTTMEPEFWGHLPDRTTLHSARMHIEETTDQGLARMDQDLERAMHLLSTAAVDILCYGCTSGSFREGETHAVRLRERIEQETGIPAVVTSEAVVEALRELGLKRIVVGTPYIDDLNQKEQEFLEAHGFEVLGLRGLGIVPNLEIGRCEPDKALRLGLQLLEDHPAADGLFLSCTNFPTFAALDELKAANKGPVVTSNQASLWMTCRQAGLRGSFWGLEC